ncbi:MAG: SH3 domain-containing protein [Microbacterium sp.]|uniref:SH3 domain-containing protein n=1 Tax=Microbacterium sp. TaxID=51671 RepID=UPI0039E53F15
MRSIRSLLLTVPVAVAVVLAGAPAPATASSPTAVHIAAAPEATTFRNPLKASYTVVSFYGPRCIPLRGASTWHLGEDLAASSGSGIYSIAAGKVTATVNGSSAQAGYIDVRHTIGSTKYISRYYHIWKATTRVKVGQIVKAGQRISEVGNSGVSGGPHLHLEIWKVTSSGNVSVNPYKFLKKRGVNIRKEARAVTAQKAPATCTYYTATKVNFRTGASTSSPILSVLPKGTPMVHVPGQRKNGFLPVKIGEQRGWVSWPLVTPVKPTVVSLAALTPANTAKDYVNLRKKPSLKGKIIVVIPKGASLSKVKATHGDWRKVTYLGKTGWMHKDYLQSPPTVYTAKSAVNLRKKPSLSGKILLVIPKGAYIGSVQAKNGVWRKVTYNDTTGWMHKNYLKKLK